MYCDFIEIGTSDFDTEIEKNDNKKGISVEPIQYYLDRIPNKKDCNKLKLGISNYNGKCTVHYLSEQTIQKYDFPFWVRGCNTINSFHKQVSDLCYYKGVNIEDITEKDEVDVLTLYTLMMKYEVVGVYFLKIDTEGHDTVILERFFEEVQDRMYLPHVIKFESNELSTNENVYNIIHKFQSIGYEMFDKNLTDTVLKLNLKKLKNKTKFTPAIQNYYIMDYPLHYSVSNLPHENTLEGAKEYCIEHHCSGVTLDDGVYQVRDGEYMNYVEGNTSSWVFI